MRRSMLPLILMAALLLVVQSRPIAAAESVTSADAASSEVASSWFELLYDIVKAQGMPPPQASRIYGITSVALYESIVPGTELNRSLVGQLNGLIHLPQPNKKLLHWPTVANTTLANTIRGVFPNLSSVSLYNIKSLELSFANRFKGSVPVNTYNQSVARGHAVAAGILSWASGDGFSMNNNCPYIPAALPGAWQPTPPAFNPNPLQPCWGFLRPMVLTSGSECPPVAHPAFSTNNSSDFYAAGLEVYNIGLGLTDEQKLIAIYWADGPGATGTPPGHWIAIVSQIAQNDRLSLARAAEAYARVGIAVHDAFIACWNAKYATNLQRPVTYIRQNINASWTPFIGTPNFPTYTSGHSTQSGAAAAVLTQMFGIKRFVDTTHTDHGLTPALSPRTFDSFDEASAEAAVSRLYGGIHYSFDNNNGLTCGQCIGQKIQERVSFSTN
ncbi:MAG TPA: vanadium-dependent haloperoxidase [Blastocatellia bacterium]|nr:vanadium-dependent haloperoxidase [Blastocatellia bacterium]